MAYNPYQFMYQQQYQQPQGQNNIIWISGEAGAKSYLIAPNTTVPLWDSEANVIYVKSADASGMPSMKVLDYTVRDTTPARPDPVKTVDYVTHDELKEFEERILKEVRHESNANHANGRRAKKQPDGGAE